MPTEPQINQAIVNAIAERLNVLRKQPCPFCHGYGTLRDIVEDPGSVSAKCAECNGLGTITEPRYQAAWEMLWPLASRLVVGGIPSSYTKHPVMDWPDCAVVGLLEGVVRKVHSPKLYAFLVNWKHGDNPMPEEWATKWFMENILPFHWPDDPDDAPVLGKALLEALNGYK